MKRILMVMSIFPLSTYGMDVFNGQDYLAGKKTPFNPNAYINYINNATEPVKGAGILPLVRDENGVLHAILAQAVVENGEGKENGASLVYITPSQDKAFDFEKAVTMASRAEELRILDNASFNPEKVEAAIYKAHVALPGNGLIRRGYGTMSYAAVFEDLEVQKVKDFCQNVQPQLDAIADIVDAQQEKTAYNNLFPTSSEIERSDRIRRFHVVPVNTLLGAIEKAYNEATAQEEFIKAPVKVEGYGAVASYVARTLALHLDTLKKLK